MIITIVISVIIFNICFIEIKKQITGNKNKLYFSVHEIFIRIIRD